jgi:predicted protein tyrosine phosphatase
VLIFPDALAPTQLGTLDVTLNVTLDVTDKEADGKKGKNNKDSNSKWTFLPNNCRICNVDFRWIFTFLLGGNPAQEIIPGIYIGGVWNGMNVMEARQDCKSKSIDAMVTLLTEEEYNAMKQMEDTDEKEDKRERLHVVVANWNCIRTQIVKIFTWIQERKEKNRNVLIHCWEGRYRSVTLVIMYLMCMEKMTQMDATAWVKQKHPMATEGMPNLMDWDVEKCRMEL